ncbi:MAG: cell division protein FtsQ/DivIB [Candidatus Muiribacteriota bacterium]
MHLVKVLVILILIFIMAFQTRIILKDISFLNVREVDIIGNNYVEDSTILYLSKVTQDKNLIKINIERGRQLILTEPFIQSAGINIENRKVKIHIIEREPYVYLKAEKGFLAFDKKGVPLSWREKINSIDLPVMSGVKNEFDFSLGKKITHKEIINGLSWFKELPDDFIDIISEINFNNPDKIIIYTLDGVEVYVNDIKTLGERFEILYNKLLKLKEKKYHIEYADLRFGENIYIKYSE